MDGDSVATWRHIGDQLNDLAKSAVSGLVAAVRTNPLLLLIVGLTGALSYEALFGLVYHQQHWYVAAAAVFPLQFNLAGIPAYRLAADANRRRLHRFFGALVVAVVLGGSIYGNLAYHLNWVGKDTVVFTSVVSPSMCAATLIIWHLPRVVRRVVDAAQSAHRWRKAVHPTETSPVETEVTPAAPTAVGVQDRRPTSPGPVVGASLHSADITLPAGFDDGDDSPPTARAWIGAFWDLNGREPTTAEVNAAMGPAYKARNEASKHRAAVRTKRAEVSA